MNASSSYFILCQFSTGRSWVERDPALMDWQSTISDISTGQIENVVEVREAPSWRDVTKDTAEAVINEWAMDDEPVSYERYSWIEQVIGTRAARSFLRAS
jgi:hypothetical protein